MRYTIWYHLYNVKNVKNTHLGVLILVKLLIFVNIIVKLIFVNFSLQLY